MNTHLGAAIASLALALPLAACGDAADAEGNAVDTTAEPGPSRLYATIGEIDEVSTAHDLIKTAGLDTTFVGVGAYTLFLPSNEALGALPEEDMARLQTEEARPELIAMLRRHIAVGAIAKADLDQALERNGGAIQLASVADKPIDIREIDGKIVLGNAEDAPRFTGKAIAASNGVIYVIDGLIPPGD
ncbi:fasciclin domain-containing protein [Alteriqipengyuania sp. 357]